MTRRAFRYATLTCSITLAFAAAAAAQDAAAPAAPAAAAPAAGCGVVKEFDRSLTDRGVYAANVLEIDGKPTRHRDYAHELSAGPHKFKIGNQIPVGELSFQVQHSRDKSIHDHELTIDIKPNTVYLVGSKLIKESADKPKEFWAPIIYQEEGLPCPKK